LKLQPQLNELIIMLCDQPFVDCSLLNKMIETMHGSPKGIVACAYSNTIGTPVLFDKRYFKDLLNLQGAKGAKQLLNQYANDLISIDFPEGNIDIDTIEDYNKLN